MRNKVKEMTREELYDLVWSEPMIKAAKHFALSDVGLKKICLKNNVPIPGRGYWRKLETGKKVKKTPLPTKINDPTISINVYDQPPNPEEDLPEIIVEQLIPICKKFDTLTFC